MNRLRFFLIFTCTLLSHSVFSQWTQCNGPYGASISGIASSGRRVIASSVTGEAFLSTDSGNTWLMTYSPSSNNNSYSSVSSIDNKVMLLDGGVSIYLSSDTGSTWNFISNLSNLQFRNGLLDKNGIYLNRGTEIYRSFDFGLNWTNADSGLQSSDIYQIQSFGDTLYAAYINLQTLGIAVSFDFGDHWSCHNSQFTNNISSMMGMVADSFGVIAVGGFGMIKFDLATSSFTTISQTGWDQGITKIDSNYYFLETSRLYKSTDIINRQEIDSGFYRLSSILPVKSGQRLVDGNITDGIYVSDNLGTSWIMSNTGINTSCVRNIFDIDTAIIIATSNSGMFYSTDNGLSWIESNNGISKPGILLVMRHDSIFVASTVEGIYRSTNNGQTWSLEYTYLNGGYPASGYYYNNRFFINIEDNVLMSADYGQTWNSIGCPTSIIPSGFVFHGDSIFLSIGRDTVYAKNVDSLSWGRILVPFGFSFVGQNDSAWFAYTQGGVSKSNDFGVNWSTLISPFVFVSPFILDNKAIFASDSLIYYSTDYGNSFAVSNGPRNKSSATSALIKDSTFYVGTWNRGIWKTDVALVNNIPKQWDTSTQIYPNPTSGLINVTLDNSDDKIILKNIVGQICPATIASSGDNFATLDLSPNPAGLYFLFVSQHSVEKAYRVVIAK